MSNWEEEFAKQKKKEKKKRQDDMKKIPVAYIEAMKNLAECSQEIAHCALYEGGPRYIYCDTFHLLEQYSDKIKDLLLMDGKYDD